MDELTSKVTTRHHAIEDRRWQWIERWLNAVRLHPNSRRSYEREWRRFLDYLATPLWEVTGRDIRAYKESLQGQLSINSIDVAMTALKSFYRWAETVDGDLYLYNPAASVRIERFEGTNLEQPSPEALAEVSAVVGAQAELGYCRNLAIYRVLLLGLSAEVITNLNIGSWKTALDGNPILLITSLDRPTPTQIDLPEETATAIADYLELRQQYRETPLTNDLPLFVNHHRSHKYHDRRMSYRRLYAIVRQWADLAGIDSLKPQTFKKAIKQQSNR
jgi:integrase/recombinase XerD